MSANQARDGNGRFAAGGHGAEAGTRDSGRFPVTAHAGQQSLATRTGKLLQAGTATANPAQGEGCARLPLSASASFAALMRDTGTDSHGRNHARRIAPQSQPTNHAADFAISHAMDHGLDRDGRSIRVE